MLLWAGAGRSSPGPGLTAVLIRSIYAGRLAKANVVAGFAPAAAHASSIARGSWLVIVAGDPMTTNRENGAPEADGDQTEPTEPAAAQPPAAAPSAPTSEQKP